MMNAKKVDLTRMSTIMKSLRGCTSRQAGKLVPYSYNAQGFMNKYVTSAPGGRNNVAHMHVLLCIH